VSFATEIQTLEWARSNIFKHGVSCISHSTLGMHLQEYHIQIALLRSKFIKYSREESNTFETFMHSSPKLREVILSKSKSFKTDWILPKSKQ
jgi:chorismate-pyruvate lyase